MFVGGCLVVVSCVWLLFCCWFDLGLMVAWFEVGVWCGCGCVWVFLVVGVLFAYDACFVVSFGCLWLLDVLTVVWGLVVVLGVPTFVICFVCVWWFCVLVGFRGLFSSVLF